MTDKQKEDLWVSLNYIYLLTELIIIEYLHFFDRRFRQPNLNNFMSRIKKDARAIQSSLNIRPQTEDLAEDRAIALHRVLRYFSDKPTEEINQLMDKIDE